MYESIAWDPEFCPKSAVSALQNHQTDQLKQEISSKDSLLMKVKYDHIKVGGRPRLSHLA